ncbi:PEP-CTERM sorting domain-containing protein [Paludisphaera soli]|uniref:PEP-CTERM sorting domain-containing protein n=1 Tax=Paludisphaera soli TaxID=2712865 RepID=UPI0013EA3705|nr:PEP-CTERM sorting domain-containing protein [Paludisphaera soli]
MSVKMIRLASALAVALAATTWAAPSASALSTTYALSTNITNNGNSYVGNQLFVDVNDVAGQPQQVDFVFRNVGPVASSITDVYFDDGTLLTLLSTTVNSSAGVAFSAGASPGNLPGGNAVNFQTTAGFSADSDSPVSTNGVNPGEYLTVRFALQGVQTYASVINALALGLANPGVNYTGALRIGVHVQAISPQGGSDSYINGEPVPEPSTLAIAGLGALGMIGYGLRRRARS